MPRAPRARPSRPRGARPWFGRAPSWFVLLMLVATPARAWNGAGHRQIALLGYDQMGTAARARASTLLRRHPRFQADFLAHLPARLPAKQRERWLFAQAATWPDLARSQRRFHHGPWHYVNLRLERLAGEGEGALAGPLSSCAQGRIAMQARRPPEGRRPEPADIELALRHQSGILADPAAPAARRALALSWVVHLVGDAHQPLHSVALFTPRLFAAGDRGGNEIVDGQRGSLHRVWDSLLGEDESPEGLKRSLAQLRRVADFARIEREARLVPDVPRWIDESCELARSAVYAPRVLAAVERWEREGLDGKPRVDVPASELERARRLARRRAIQAGARLAALLSRALK